MKLDTFLKHARTRVRLLASHVGRGEAPNEAEEYRRLAKLCEALVVLSLTFALCGWFVALRLSSDANRLPKEAGWWLALCLVVLAAAFIVAALCNYYAQEMDEEGEKEKREAAKRETKAKYQITELRIATLKAKGVPQDVRRCLRELMKSPPTGVGGATFDTKQELLKAIRAKLGHERTQEYEDIILKYSKTWDEAEGDGAARPPVEGNGAGELPTTVAGPQPAAPSTVGNGKGV